MGPVWSRGGDRTSGDSRRTGASTYSSVLRKRDLRGRRETEEAGELMRRVSRGGFKALRKHHEASSGEGEERALKGKQAAAWN